MDVKRHPPDASVALEYLGHMYEFCPKHLHGLREIALESGATVAMLQRQLERSQFALLRATAWLYAMIGQFELDPSEMMVTLPARDDSATASLEQELEFIEGVLGTTKEGKYQ